MRGRGEDGHVGTDLGDDALRRPLADPGHGVDPGGGLSERGHERLHLPIQGGDRLIQMLDQVKRDADEQGMVLAEATPQRLAQLRDLAPHPRLRQLCQHLWISLARHEGLQHGGSRHPQDVGGDRSQLDAGILQGLLDALALVGTVPPPGRTRWASSTAPWIPSPRP